MVRDATNRFVLTFLTVFLLALQLCAFTTPFPSAHHAHGVQVAAPKSPDRPTGEDADQGTDEGTYGVERLATSDRDVEPRGLTRTRDRHRSAADSPTEPHPRSAVTRDPVAERPPTALAAPGGAHVTARSSTAHSPAVLQVFRC